MRKILKSKGLLATWGFSYLIIMAIFLCASLWMFSNFKSKMTDEIDEFNNYVVYTVSRNTENILSGSKTLQYIVCSYDGFSSVLRSKNSDLYFKDKDIYSYRNFISYYKSMTNNVDFFYLYFPYTDTVFSSSGVLNSYNFYITYLSDSGFTYEAWKEHLKTLDNGSYYHIKVFNNSTLYDALACDLKITDNNLSEENYAILSTITNQQRFFDGVDKIKWTKQSDIFLYDKHGQLILSKVASDKSYVPQHVNDINKISNNYNIIQQRVFSDSVEMLVVTVTPKDIIYSKLNSTRNAALVAITICFILIAMIAGFFIHSNHLTIQKTLTMMNVTSKKSDFLQIQNAVKNIVNKNQSLESAFDKQNKELQRITLSNILRHTYIGGSPQESLESCNIVFNHKRFAVVTFHVDSLEHHLRDFGEMDLNQKYEHLSFIILNIFEELLNSDDKRAYVTVSNNIITCIINYDCDISDITSTLDYGVDFINSSFDLIVNYSISNEHKSVNDIAGAYTETLMALDYKQIFEINGNIKYSDITNKYENYYFFTQEKEQFLIGYLKSGDVDGAKDLLCDVFKQLVGNENISTEYAKCLMFDIASSVFKLPDTLGINDDELMKFFVEHSSMLHGTNLNEMMVNITKFIESFCEYVNTFDQNEPKMSKKIIKFLEQNYSDSNLSITTIGEEFNISAAYISKKFKKERGETLVSFITKFRLEKSKELIRNTNHSLNTVAEMVGFSHIRTFNRVFKKQEGITPSEFRETYR